MRRHISIFAFICLLLIVLFTLDKFVTYKFQNSYFDLCNKWRWVASKRNNSYDLVVHGSSRAANIFNAKKFEEKTGLRTINIATSGSSFADNYLLLWLFLKNDNSTKTLLLQADAYGLCSDSSYTYPFHAFEYFPYLEEENVSLVMKDNVRATKFFAWKYVPFFRYAEFNDTYNVVKMFKGGFNCNPEQSSFTSGNGYENSSRETEFMSRKARKLSICEKDVAYLKKIVDLCKEKNICLVAYNAPEYRKYITNNESYQVTLHYLQNFFKEQNIPFLNFSVLEFCMDESLFADPTHLNTNGVERLMDTISSQNILEQMRIK